MITHPPYPEWDDVSQIYDSINWTTHFNGRTYVISRFRLAHRSAGGAEIRLIRLADDGFRNSKILATVDVETPDASYAAMQDFKDRLAEYVMEDML